MRGITKLTKQVEKLITDLETTILDREEYWNRRSEKWQESDKGVAFLELTEQIREAESLLDEARDYLTESDGAITTPT